MKCFECDVVIKDDDFRFTTANDNDVPICLVCYGTGEVDE